MVPNNTNNNKITAVNAGVLFLRVSKFASDIIFGIWYKYNKLTKKDIPFSSNKKKALKWSMQA